MFIHTIASMGLHKLPYPKDNIIGSLRRPYLQVKLRILSQIGSHPIVWYCNRLSPNNPHVRGLQLYYWLCSMSVILILRALGTFDKILWDENSLLPHHPCAWNLQRFWIWSPSFHCRKKILKCFQDLNYFKYLVTEILTPISKTTNPEFISLHLLLVLIWLKRIFNLQVFNWQSKQMVKMFILPKKANLLQLISILLLPSLWF